MFLQAWNHSEEPRSDFCVTHVNCSIRLTHRHASPVSLSIPTVLSMHKIEPKRGFPNKNLSLDFLNFLSWLLILSSVTACCSWKKLLKLLSVPDIVHFLLFAFVKSSPHVLLSEISHSILKAWYSCIFFSKEQSSPDILLYVGRNVAWWSTF